MRCKCYNCFLIFDDHTNICPICKKEAMVMCKNDHVCTCALEVTAGMQTCEICGKPTCKCGSHDVEVISRVTGYLQDVDGWNAAKKQELKDRQRYNVGI